MKITEEIKKYRGMDEEALALELKDKIKDLTLVSLKVKVGKHDNISQVDKLKKDVARIKTIIAEKQYGVQDGE